MLDYKEIYKIFNIDTDNIHNYSKDDIKNRYKKIALECHPDKLQNIDSADEKAEKTEKFKNASIGYKQLMADFDKYGKLQTCLCDSEFDMYSFDEFERDFEIYKDCSFDFWKDALDEFMSMNKEDKCNMFANAFQTIADFMQAKDIKPKAFYNPSVRVIKHKLKLPISYYDLYTSDKKKVRVVLKGLDEPLYINVECAKKYPEFVTQYIDDDGIEHDINIKMKLYSDDENQISHNIREDGCIDLIMNISINYLQYICGCEKEVQYINKENIKISVPPFLQSGKIVMENHGLIGGDLIVFVNVQNIQEDNWWMLKEKDRDRLIKIFRKMRLYV